MAGTLFSKNGYTSYSKLKIKWESFQRGWQWEKKGHRLRYEFEKHNIKEVMSVAASLIKTHLGAGELARWAKCWVSMKAWNSIFNILIYFITLVKGQGKAEPVPVFKTLGKVVLCQLNNVPKATVAKLLKYSPE